MSLTLREVMEALPEEELSPAADGMEAWRVAVGAPPTSGLRRGWALAALPARIALAYLAYWLRSGFASADERAKQRNEMQLRAAIGTLARMSYLRGPAMKFGQVLAAYPEVLPVQLAELLGQLSFEAPPMHAALVREVMRRELGGEPEALFEWFEPRPIASASLGQVHRAKLRGGPVVAVKVQYPDMGRVIDADLDNLLRAMWPLRLTSGWASLNRQMEDIRAMLLLECDYRREAELLRRAAAAFSSGDGVVIPAPHAALSTARVLTMEFVDGMHVDRFLREGPSADERDRFGERIMRASFRLAHRAKLWYADSNPGNYLFRADGTLGLIDFGCCREFSRDEWRMYYATARGLFAGGAALERALRMAADLSPDEPIPADHMAAARDLSEWYSGYLRRDEPFDFGDGAFMRRGVELFARIMRRGYVRTMPVNTWIGRQLIGLRCLAHRLGARVNMRRIALEEAPELFAAS